MKTGEEDYQSVWISVWDILYLILLKLPVIIIFNTAKLILYIVWVIFITNVIALMINLLIPSGNKTE